MDYRVEDRVPGMDDWKRTTWNVVLRDTSYLMADAVIDVHDDLNATVTQGGTTYEASADLLHNGLLIVEGTTLADTVTANNQQLPAGTSFWLVLSMVILQDTAGDKIRRYVKGLTLVGDPEDAGIMGAEEGGNG